MTPEEEAFIGGIEMAMDWNLPIPEEDLKRFFELINREECVSDD